MLSDVSFESEIVIEPSIFQVAASKRLFLKHTYQNREKLKWIINPNIEILKKTCRLRKTS